jgi:hypothetical protein
MKNIEISLLDIPNEILLDIAKDKLSSKLEWTRENDFDIELTDINSGEVSITFSIHSSIDLIDLDIYCDNNNIDIENFSSESV